MEGLLASLHFQGPTFQDKEDDSVFGSVVGVTKTLITAELKSCALYDIVKVGASQALGEVIRLEDNNVVAIQLFENASGITVGDIVEGTNTALQVELGPGILGQFFDGIQRPLDEMTEGGKKIYLPKHGVPALDKTKIWNFEPKNFKEGDFISGGDIFGIVPENYLITHRIMLPPRESGTIVFLAPASNYNLNDIVISIDSGGGTIKSFTMLQKWNLKEQRPLLEKKENTRPLFSGRRVCDMLFPPAVGGTIMIPGALGCNKSTTMQTIARQSNSDITIYVDCGERTTESCEELMSYVEMTVDGGHGLQRPLLERMCLVSNSSNMSAVGRVASIYTGAVIAEYFRDQGYNATLIANNTSRWEEALHETYSTLSHEYAPWKSLISAFYERAGSVTCVGSQPRSGSLTILATVGMSNTEFTHTTFEICETFWGLDKRLAQRRHYPEINYLLSYSRIENQLLPHFENLAPDYVHLRDTFRTVLQKEDDLLDIPLDKRDSLDEPSQLVLHIGKFIREYFLQQNVFTPYDKYCPTYKSFWMMRNIVASYDLALKAIQRGATVKQITSESMSLQYKLTQMKYQDPYNGEQAVVNNLRELNTEICEFFRDFEPKNARIAGH